MNRLTALPSFVGTCDTLEALGMGSREAREAAWEARCRDLVGTRPPE